MAADPSSRQLPAEPTLRLIHSLAERRTRDASGLFFVEGVRCFLAALQQGWSVHTLVYSERLLIVPPARQWVRRLKRAQVPYVRLSPEQFRSISRTTHVSGIGAILRQRTSSLDQLPLPERACWVAVGQLRAAGNLGTLLRSSVAAGCAGCMFLGASADPFDPQLVRASMGALFASTLVRTNATELRQWTQRHAVQVVGASPEAPVSFKHAHYGPRLVLLLGEERRGLTAEQRELCDQLVRIPMQGNLDSLNVGVAGSLLLYEIADVGFRGGPGDAVELRR